MATIKQAAMERRYVSVQDAGEITGLSPWTWRRWVYSGKVASVKVGKGQRGRLLIPLAEIDRVMSQGLRPSVEGADGYEAVQPAAGGAE